MSNNIRLLLTGATGYIGGAVLTTLLNTKYESLKNLVISALVRGEDQAKKLKELGVNPILFTDLDDTDIITKAASEHDVVIHTASGFHSGSAKALIVGLGERKKNTKKEVYYIHTSGTSNLGDRPITGQYHESKEFSDEDDVYSYLKSREEKEAYPQRTTDLLVVQTGKEVNVNTYIIMSPTIYGIGNGPFNKHSIQIPTIIKGAIKAGRAEVIGSGSGMWDYVHILDLAPLYELMLAKLVAGEDLPHGEKGIYFSSTGRYSWRELSERIGKALHSISILKSAEVHEIGLDDASSKWAGGHEKYCELGFASNSKTVSNLGRKLGWKPQKTEQDFHASFDEEVKYFANDNNAKDKAYGTHYHNH